MNLFATDSFEALTLRDEFQWLQQCLDASECSRKQLQGTVKQQQQRIAQLKEAVENAGQVAAAQAERQWKQELQQKECEWMQEYDGQMQSLLRIIRHHERTHKQMETQLLEARGAMREKASSATQTDAVVDICGDQGDIHHHCRHECTSQHEHSREGHPDMVESSSALSSLEKQNRVLKGRLAAQQSVLDRLLSSGLQGMTSTSSPSRSTSGAQTEGGAKKTPNRMTKLRSPLGNSTTDINQMEEPVDTESAVHHPLSPAAA